MAWGWRFITDITGPRGVKGDKGDAGGFDPTGLARIVAIETKNTAQDGRLDAVEARFGRGILPTGTDLNALYGLADAGSWGLSVSNTYLNAPAFPSTAVLEVVRGGGNTVSVLQRVTAGSFAVWREAADAAAGTWSAWEQAGTVSGSTANLTAAKAYTDTEVGKDRTRLASIEAKNVAQDTRMDGIDTRDAAQDTRMAGIDARDTAQDGRMDRLESKDTVQDELIRIEGGKNRQQDTRLTGLEAVSPVVSNIALDTDGNPFFSPGSTQVHVIPDPHGVPYYITFLSAQADADGNPYFS